MPTISTATEARIRRAFIRLQLRQTRTLRELRYLPLSRPTETIPPVTGWVLWQYPSSSQTQVDKYTGIADTTPSVTCVSCRHDQTILDGLARATSAIIKSDPDGSA